MQHSPPRDFFYGLFIDAHSAVGNNAHTGFIIYIFEGDFEMTMQKLSFYATVAAIGLLSVSPANAADISSLFGSDSMLVQAATPPTPAAAPAAAPAPAPAAAPVKKKKKPVDAAAAPVAAPAPAPVVAAAPAAPSLSMPPMAGPLGMNTTPMSFDGGPLSKIYVTGAVTGIAMAQSNPVPGNHHSVADVTNGQVFIQNADGPVQFMVEAGTYATPSLGTAYLSANKHRQEHLRCLAAGLPEACAERQLQHHGGQAADADRGMNTPSRSRT